MKDPLLDVNGISVTYSRWGQSLSALKNVSFSCMTKEWVMIAGANGSGKSTLLNVIAGFITPSSGSLNISTELNQELHCSSLFYIKQDPIAGTASQLTLIENFIVADPRSSARGNRLSDLKDDYMNMLSTVGLSHRANQLLQYFSGGERQLIALLIAKLRKPRILLLDEPFAALDAAKVPLCLTLLGALNETGSTILHVSHDIDAINTMGNRTIAFHNGELILDQSGGVRNFKL